MKVYRTTIEVRGYELDSYGHVNNAVYLNYLEHARWKMLENSSVTRARMKEWKRWPVVASIEAKYLKPAFMGEQLEIETEALELRRVSLTARHTIRRNGETIFQASVGLVIVNENGRPAEMPEEMMAVWSESP